MNWIQDTLRFNGRMRCRNLISLCHVGRDWSSETWNQPQIWPMFKPPKVRFRCLTSLTVCIPLPRGNKKHQKEPTHTDFPKHEPKHVVVLTQKMRNSKCAICFWNPTFHTSDVAWSWMWHQFRVVVLRYFQPWSLDANGAPVVFVFWKVPKPQKEAGLGHSWSWHVLPTTGNAVIVPYSHIVSPTMFYWIATICMGWISCRLPPICWMLSTHCKKRPSSS